jgi:hypothetical protein
MLAAVRHVNADGVGLSNLILTALRNYGWGAISGKTSDRPRSV